MLRAKRAEKNWFVPPYCDILGYIWGKTAVWGQLPPVPLPGYVTDCNLSARINYSLQLNSRNVIMSDYRLNRHCTEDITKCTSDQSI